MSTAGAAPERRPNYTLRTELKRLLRKAGKACVSADDALDEGDDAAVGSALGRLARAAVAARLLAGSAFPDADCAVAMIREAKKASTRLAEHRKVILRKRGHGTR